MRSTIIVALTAVFFTCCLDKSVGSTNGNNHSDIRNIWWKLEAFETISGDSVTLASDQLYLAFFADASLSGKTDSMCGNTYYASWTLGNNDSLFIGPITTTKRGCRTSYTDYLRALEKATSFQIIDSTLIICHSGGTKRLLFVKE